MRDGNGKDENSVEFGGILCNREGTKTKED